MSNRLLFISPLLAMPEQHGGCVYPDAILRALRAAGTTIDYAWLAWPLRGSRRLMRDPLRAGYVSRGYIPGTWQCAGWRLRTLGQIVATPGAKPANERRGETLPTAEEQRFFRRLMKTTGHTTVLVDFTTTLPVLDGLSKAERSRLHVAVLTHNLVHRRTELYRAHDQPLDFLPLTAAEETALLARADTIVAIQEREADSFHALLPSKTVVTVPLPLPAEALPLEKNAAPVCLFVGGKSGHNLAGLAWLLAEIWPAVRRACPEARLHIAGTLAEAVPAGAAGVYPLGPVADLRGAYAAARVALAPLPMGTGLKIKVVEAMGFGRPVVTTSAGAEGFAELERGELAVVADSAADFAAAILRLLQSPDEWERVARRQSAWIERICAPRRAITPLLEAWDKVAATPSN